MEKVVAFDLDGTLLDSADDLLLSLNTLLDELNMSKVNKSDINDLVGNGALVMIQKAFKLNNLKYKNNNNNLLMRFIEIYKTCFLKNSKLYEHVAYVLKKLHKNNFKLIIVSNKTEFFIHKILDHFDIKKYFSAISGGDTFAFKKPNPKHLTETIKKINLINYQCTFVGDSINDAICAKENDSKLILMSYGYSQENIHDMKADLVTDDLRDILKFLGV
tara:strand:+ start:561 stop:1214 length:654 start_codon:yes stop_codon:yes gene_type:complete